MIILIILLVLLTPVLSICPNTTYSTNCTSECNCMWCLDVNMCLPIDDNHYCSTFEKNVTACPYVCIDCRSVGWYLVIILPILGICLLLFICGCLVLYFADKDHRRRMDKLETIEMGGSKN